jgi:hypothetical protein
VYKTGVKRAHDDPVASKAPTGASSPIDIQPTAAGAVLISSPVHTGYDVRISDCSGRLLHVRRGVATSRCIVPLSQTHGAGLYFITVRRGSRSVTRRVVVH